MKRSNTPSAYIKHTSIFHTRPALPHFQRSFQRARLCSHPEENAESSGDTDLQELLVQQINRRVGKQRLFDPAKKSKTRAERQRLMDLAKGSINQAERQRLFDAAKESIDQAEKQRLLDAVRAMDEAMRLLHRMEDLKEQVDRREKLELDRNKLEFDSRQADVNKAADDFDQILRKSRAEMEISKAENEAFEQAVERDQNRHLFFQGLYKREKKKKMGQNRWNELGRYRDNKQTESFVQRQAELSDKMASMKRALRIFVYGLTAFNVAALVLTDVLSENHPSAADALLGFSAILLGRFLWTQKLDSWKGRL